MSIERVTSELFRLRTLMVNVYLVRDRTANGWVLIDAGLPGYQGTIRRFVESVAGGAPRAILLTHGHFDHVGALPGLARDWGVPIYVHPLELPYVTGEEKYPPPNPLAGGSQSLMSPLFSRGPFDFGDLVHALPPDGEVPWLDGWRWMATPGHTRGHVSFIRDEDRVVVAGDAVITTRQESTINVMVQREIVARPPAYFTPDWDAAGRSVRAIADYEPDLLATGHGHPMRGAQMRIELHDLADHFEDHIPAVRESPAIVAPALLTAMGVGAAVGVGMIVRNARQRRG
jgi:glyoxylase-like metal-dependent hydrolase (beta-lactamase superfamily II)